MRTQAFHARQRRDRGSGRAEVGALLALAIAGLLLAAGCWLSRNADRVKPGSGLGPRSVYVPVDFLRMQAHIRIPAGGSLRGEMVDVWARVYWDGNSAFDGGHSDFELIVDGERAFLLEGAPIVTLGSEDLTGDGIPEIVFTEANNTAPGQCMETTHVLVLWPRFHHQSWFLSGCEGGFVQKDEDAPLEFLFGDSTYEDSLGDEPYYWRGGGRGLPELVLKFAGVDCNPSAALRRPPLESFSGMDWPAPDTAQPTGEDRGRDGTSQGWDSNVLDLIYAGHAREAWVAMEAMWPSHPDWMSEARKDIIERLRKSPYWETLVEMNGTALDP